MSEVLAVGETSGAPPLAGEGAGGRAPGEERISPMEPSAAGPLASCPACGGNLPELYRMERFSIHRCEGCGNGVAQPFPGPEELRAFYDGFIPHLSLEWVQRRKGFAKAFFNELLPGRQGRFMDIGGGSALFAKVWEELGRGPSTYVDLDPVSARFAGSLGVDETIQADAAALGPEHEGRYTVIYARHLVEHLTDPWGFMRRLVDYLEPGGKLIIQCPNGESLEYLLYPESLENRIGKIGKATGWRRWRIFRAFLSGGMLHAIDPPRHLWAISSKAMRTWASREGLSLRLTCKHLGQMPYSPGYPGAQGRGQKLRHWIAQHLLAPIRGGTHLVAVIERGGPVG